MTERELLVSLLDEVNRLKETVKRQAEAIELLVDDRQYDAYQILKGTNAHDNKLL